VTHTHAHPHTCVRANALAHMHMSSHMCSHAHTRTRTRMHAPGMHEPPEDQGPKFPNLYHLKAFTCTNGLCCLYLYTSQGYTVFGKHDRYNKSHSATLGLTVNAQCSLGNTVYPCTQGACVHTEHAAVCTYTAHTQLSCMITTCMRTRSCSSR